MNEKDLPAPSGGDVRLERLLARQRDLALALARAGGLAEAFRLCTETAIDLGEMDGGGLYVVDRTTGCLDLVYHTGLSDAFVAVSRHYDAHSPNARLVMEGAPVFVRHEDLLAGLDEVSLREGLRAVAVIPVTHEGRIVACLNLASRARDEIAEAARVALVGVAAQIGQAVVGAQDRAAAEEQRESLATFFDCVPDFLFVLDAEGRVVKANRAALERLGRTEEELAGRHVSLVHPPGRREEVERTVAAVLAGEASECLVPLVARDGVEVPVETRCTVGTWNGRPSIFGVCRDLSRAVAAEHDLRESDARLRALLDSTPQGVLFEDDARRVRVTNRAYCEIFGIPSVEALQGSDCGDGVRATSGLFEDPEGFAAGVRARIAGGRPVAGEELRLADGRVLERDFVPIEIEGARRGVLWTYRDVTERARGEADRLEVERQLQQTQKLESLGVLAAGIAHDFNNLLVAIMGNASLALEELPEGSVAREAVLDVERASRRAGDLCGQLLAYAGKRALVGERFPVGPLVEEMAALLRAAISKSTHLVLRLLPDLPSIEGDASQIRQVVMNLIVNASEALGDEPGSVRVRTDAVDVGELSLSAAGAAGPARVGPQVLLEVSDTGRGMDAETRRRMFDPFFSTKTMGRGLGMATVLGIVRAHGGSISVESDPGRGTTVRVLLPSASPSTRGERCGDPGEDEAFVGSGTVLVADDEAWVRDVVARMLEKLGFAVVTAADGREALRVYRLEGASIELVLLDLSMPVMGGEETLLALRQLDPAVKVVVTSGHAEADVAARLAGSEPAAIIAKPYTLSELRRCLCEVLASR